MKRGYHSSDTSPNWNEPSIFLYNFFNFLLCWMKRFFFHIRNFDFIFILNNHHLFFIKKVKWLFIQRSETLLLDRVRLSVRAVVPCNVLLTDPLMNDKDAAQNADGCSSLYDVIITTLCLEFDTLSVDEYSSAVGNVTSLLRPQGFLVVQVNIFKRNLFKRKKWTTNDGLFLLYRVAHTRPTLSMF